MQTIHWTNIYTIIIMSLWFLSSTAKGDLDDMKQKDARQNKNSLFSNRCGFVLAAVGSAVGMANVWGFPAKMGANGGGAFLVAYL